MRKPWNKYSDKKPWIQRMPSFGIARHDTPEYHTRRWRNARSSYLLDHPLCVHCEMKGIVRTADMVDHKISKQDGCDFWDQSNWQSLCNHCHRIKTNKEIAKRHDKVK